MTELPEYSDVEWMTPPVFFGLVNQRSRAALTAHYDHSWMRDRALLELVDAALRTPADDAPVGEPERPRWLDGLIDRQLRTASTTYWSKGTFPRVRLLERLGVIRPEVDETYVLAMISSLGPNKADTLRRDRQLLDRALQFLFEIEGGGEVSLTNVDRFGGGEWRSAVIELAGDHSIRREVVLSRCLRALGRDFAAYRASWFSATYLAFAPTPVEAAADQGDLRRLLGSAVPATVAFALKQLERVHPAGLLDTQDTLEALPPAALAKVKGTALQALRLATALKTDDSAAAVAVAVARTALAHPHGEVQSAAATLLASLGETVSDAVEDLTPSVRKKLGLNIAVVAPTEVPAQQRLVPPAPQVRDSDLAERTAALLEDASHPAELEAVVAGLVSREVGDLLGPLRKRAQTVVARGSMTDHGDAWLPGQVARLVLDRLGEPAPPARPGLAAQRFIVGRFAEIRAHDAPLLATPDLPGGWVSAEALVERLERTVTPRPHDLTAALLRLHPEGREAVSDATYLPAAVRYALGMSDGNTKRERRQGLAAWWRAAERSLAPYSDTERPRLRSDRKAHTWQRLGREHRARYVEFSVSMMGRVSVDDQPTELGPEKRPRGMTWGFDRPSGAWIPHIAWIWPHDSEHFLALTAREVWEAPRETTAPHDVPLVIDSLAQHPGRMGPLAVATLAAGLSATQRDHRLHAIDAFIDLVPSRRIRIIDVVTSLAEFADVWPASRWAESLAAIALAPGGRPIVVDLLSFLLPRLNVDHRGLHELLRLLRDETLRLGARPTDPQLRAWLSTLTGKSMSASIARDLLS